jgi:arylsulfatase A-like enzyme
MWHKIGGLTIPHDVGAIRFNLAAPGGVVGLCEPMVLCEPPQPSQQLNVILVDLDTMRADRLGCYGYVKRPTSARLDSLFAAKGFALFANAHSSSPWTLPATAKFFASRYLDFDLPGGIPRSYTMLAEVLRNRGYYCIAYTGGAHLRATGLEQGFHEYHWSQDWGKVEDSFPPSETWLQQQRREPFFLFLHTYEPHTPYTRDIFCRGLPSGRLGNLSHGEPLMPPGITICSRLSEAESLYVQAAYDGGVRVACDAVADLFLRLDELELWERTVVVILSDHGEEFWEHFPAFADHGYSLYSEQIRVPFLIRDPTSCTSELTTVADPVSTVDLLPTLADLLGFELGHPVDGVSLTPVMNGGEAHREVPILAQIVPGAEVPLERFCVVAEGKKYIQSFGYPARPSKKGQPCIAYGGGRELYDLQRDPGEIHNLIDVDRSLGQTMGMLLRAARNSACSLHVNAPSPHDGMLSEDLKRQLRALGYLD